MAVTLKLLFDDLATFDAQDSFILTGKVMNELDGINPDIKVESIDPIPLGSKTVIRPADKVKGLKIVLTGDNIKQDDLNKLSERIDSTVLPDVGWNTNVVNTINQR